MNSSLDDPRYRHLPKLFDYIKKNAVVEMAIFKKQIPDTGCVTADAYDFRMRKQPTSPEVSQALRYIGIFSSGGMHVATFVNQEVRTIMYFWKTHSDDWWDIAPSEFKRLICQFRNYDQVRRGGKKWKLLPKYDQSLKLLA